MPRRARPLAWHPSGRPLAENRSWGRSAPAPMTGHGARQPNAGPSPSICEAGTGGKTPSNPHQNHVTQELTPRAHHGKTTGSGESNSGRSDGAAQIGQRFPDWNQLAALTLHGLFSHKAPSRPGRLRADPVCDHMHVRLPVPVRHDQRLVPLQSPAARFRVGGGLKVKTVRFLEIARGHFACKQRGFQCGGSGVTRRAVAQRRSRASGLTRLSAEAISDSAWTGLQTGRTAFLAEKRV